MDIFYYTLRSNIEVIPFDLISLTVEIPHIKPRLGKRRGTGRGEDIIRRTYIDMRSVDVVRR